MHENRSLNNFFRSKLHFTHNFCLRKSRWSICALFVHFWGIIGRLLFNGRLTPLYLMRRRCEGKPTLGWPQSPPVRNRSVTSQYPAGKLMLSYTPTTSPPASHSQGGVNCNPLWGCAQLSLITPRWPPAALLGRAANILRFCTRSDFAPRPRPRRRRPVLNLNWIAT